MKLRSLSLPILLLASAVLFAQSDFSADIVNTGKNALNNATTIHVTKDKMRMEPKQGQMGVVIVNFASATTDVLMPQRNMYMEMPQGQGMQRGFTFFRPSDVDNACGSWQKMANKPGGSCRKVGSATVNGRDTTEYEGTSTDGVVSHVWIDPKIVFPIKWDNNKGDSGELQNIQVGAQAASLFEIPAGYQKMDMGGMMPQMPHQ